MAEVPKDLQEAQEESFKSFIKKYGFYILIFVLVIIIIISGYSVYKKHVTRKQMYLSDAYNQIISSNAPYQDVINSSEKLYNKYPNNTYSTFALMFAAKLANQNSEPQKAIGLLNQAYTNTEDKILKASIYLRLANLYADTNNQAKVISMLTNYPYKTFIIQKDELLANVYFTEKNYSQAKVYFTDIVNKTKSNPTFATQKATYKLDLIQSYTAK